MEAILQLDDEAYMRHALKEARRAYEDDEVPIGAIVVMEGKIIARGYNQTERLTDCTAHAEIIALTSAFNFLGSKYLPEATIYVTVEPCLMCAGALYWSKIGRVVFGAEDDKNGYRRAVRLEGPAYPPMPAATGSAAAQPKVATPWPFHPKTQLTGGVLKDECARLMQDFFKARRF